MEELTQRAAYDAKPEAVLMRIRFTSLSNYFVAFFNFTLASVVSLVISKAYAVCHSIERLRAAVHVSAGLIATVAVIATHDAAAQSAASMTSRDLQVVVRALGFLQPPPSRDGWVAVVFAPGDAVSRQDAERIAALFGGGLQAGQLLLSARPVGADTLADAGTPAALIAAVSAPMATIMAAARRARIACVTVALDQVEAGNCVLWVRSEPRVEVVVNQAAARSCNLIFAAAFRMMVREL